MSRRFNYLTTAVIVLAISLIILTNRINRIEANTLLIEQLTYEQCGKSNHE